MLQMYTVYYKNYLFIFILIAYIMWRSASPVSRSAGTLSIALSYRILQEKVDILESVFWKGVGTQK